MKIGIIKKAKNAKEQTEIANEKEMIELAITQAMTKDRFGKITKEGLEEHINKNIGEGKTQVIDDGDMIVVKFVESNRYYEIDIEAYMVGGMKDWLTGGKILNCINYGTITITGKDYQYGAAGGIAGAVKGNLIIENCYNAGSSDNAILGKVSYDTKTETAINITNTYYDTTKSVSVGIIEDGITGLSETEIKNNTSFIEKLNNNIGTNAEWKKWEIGKDGYPTFE